jgi:hypothetical protein
MSVTETQGQLFGEALCRCIWYLECGRRKYGAPFTLARERWGVSARTFYRDAQRLRRAGFSVHVEGGSYGEPGSMLIDSRRSEADD